MASNNQGIMHLRIGGPASRVLACKRTDAHMATTADAFANDPRQCVRCAAKFLKMQEASARREARSVAPTNEIAEFWNKVAEIQWEPK